LAIFLVPHKTRTLKNHVDYTQTEHRKPENAPYHTQDVAFFVTKSTIQSI